MKKFNLPLLLLILLSNTLFAQLSFYDQDPIYEGPESNFYNIKYAITYDYDNDGISDILHIQHNQIYVLYGDGSTFGNEELVYEHSSTLSSISNKIDLNADDRLDFAIPSVNNEILIFEGTADGIELSETVDANANTVRLIDLDKDGHIGILFTTGFEIGYMDGNELGTFDESISITGGISSIQDAFRFQVVDIDGDSDNDLFVLDLTGVLVHVVINEDFSFTSNTSVNASETEFSYGDYNLDGFIDLAVVNSSNTLEIYLHGDAGYDLSYTYSTFNIRDIITYDYNSDGKKDILLSNFLADLTYLENQGDGTFKDPEVLISEMPRFSNHTFEDFNDDGIDDIVAVSAMSFNQVILIPLNPQVNVSEQYTSISLGPEPGTLGGTKIGDIDNDGYNDLVIFSKNGAVYIFYGNETGLDENYTQYTSNTHTNGGYLYDIDEDGLLDLIVFYQSPSGGTVGTERYLNQGDRTFSDVAPFKYTWITYDAVFDDYDQDGIDNFIVSTQSNEIVFLTVNEDDYVEYHTGSPLVISTSDLITDFKIIDVNNDTWSDLILGVNGSSEIEIHLNDQAGGFLTPSVITLTTGANEYPTGLNVGDLDNDGIVEIVAATSTGNGYKAKIFSRTDVLNDFVLSEEFDVIGSYGPSVVIDDFDGDSDLDLFINEWDNLVSTFILQNNDQWELNDEVLESFGQSYVNFAHINSDNLIDIVRTHLTYGSVQVSFNNTVFEPGDLQTEIISIEQVEENLTITLNEITNDARFVIVKEAGEVDVAPVDGVFYAQNSMFGLGGTEVGSGNHVVYSGTGNTFTIEGLSTFTDYYMRIFEYNVNTPSNDIVNYLTSQSLDSVVTIKVDQTFTAEGIQDYFVSDETFELSITSSSGLDIEIDVTGPISLIDGIATILGDGEVTLVASQEGNKYYFSQEETYSFTISKEEQILSAIGIMNYIATDEPFELKITSSSGLPVQTEISGPISVQNDIATITGSGEVTIVATQEGNEFYLPVEETYMFTISKAEQTLTATGIMNYTATDEPFELKVISSSGLAVLTEISGPINVQDDIATINGGGEVTIVATQEGNEFYLPVEETYSFTISKAEQIFSATGIMNYSATDEPFELKVISSSGLTVLTEISGPISVQDDIASIAGGGEVTIVATQEGNDFYLPKEETYSFTINKVEQTLTFENLGDIMIEVGTFEIQITASSGLPTSYNLVSGPIQINDGIATILDIGTVIIDATQAGNEYYFPVEQTFEFDIVEPLGLDSHESILYPNPTNGIIRMANVEYADELSIVDINGRARRFNLTSESTLDVSGLESGIYFVLLKSKGSLKSIRFIKE
ncbi:MAG: T9SS type A sorting domain-containing protein [Bacteroidota bacterium]